MGFLDTADRMVWPPSLSCDRKWPCVTKCTHSRVVGLRLEGNFVHDIGSFCCVDHCVNCTYFCRHLLLQSCDRSSVVFLCLDENTSFVVSRIVHQIWFTKLCPRCKKRRLTRKLLTSYFWRNSLAKVLWSVIFVLLKTFCWVENYLMFYVIIVSGVMFNLHLVLLYR